MAKVYETTDCKGFLTYLAEATHVEVRAVKFDRVSVAYAGAAAAGTVPDLGPPG
jgi:hypothetical protein